MVNTRAVKGGSTIRPVLLCGNISNAHKTQLNQMGYTVMTLPPFSRLAAPVAAHADMLLFPLSDGFLLHEAYYSEHRSFFDTLPVTLTKSDERIEKEYPYDVLFNALPLGEWVFAGKTVSRHITAAYRHVPVRQGYARCSSALVGDGVITADPSLFHALVAKGVDVLFISSGGIRLSGYDTGFIGGASLTLSPTCTAFFGRIEDHPDYHRMKDFAKKHAASLVSLSSEPLCDCGGGFLLPQPKGRS